MPLCLWQVTMNSIIPTAEEAASAADALSDYVRISFDQIPRQIRQPLTDAIISTVSPLLEAIAEGRVFEVRRELCTECDGDGRLRVDRRPRHRYGHLPPLQRLRIRIRECNMRSASSK